MTSRGRSARYGALGVGLLLVALIVVLATRSLTPQSTARSPLGGAIAPPVAGRDVVTGRPISLASLRGRYVVVDFFASWCTPCLEEEPQVESFFFAHRNATDVALIGVDIEDSPGNARLFFSQYGATWPAVVDPSNAIAQSYGVSQPPELFLVDPKGRVISSDTGPVTADQLDAWVSEAEALRT